MMDETRARDWHKTWAELWQVMKEASGLEEDCDAVCDKFAKMMEEAEPNSFRWNMVKAVSKVWYTEWKKENEYV